MKYIKLYEKYSKNLKKFKVGDYVVADNFDKHLYNYINDFVNFMTIETGKIISIEKLEAGRRNLYLYDVLYQDVPNNENFRGNMLCNISDETAASYFLNERELRLATPEEIEEYEIKQNIKNFNL